MRDPGLVSPAHPTGPVQSGWIARLAITLLVAAEIIRTLTDQDAQTRLAWYAGPTAAYMILFAFTLWYARPARWLSHLYLGTQSLLVLAMFGLDPEIDSVTAFFIPLAFQAPLLFSGGIRWLWVGILVFLTGGALVITHGVLEGMAFAMGPLAGVIALPAFMIANQEIEAARRRSQIMLAELRETNRQLQSHADQVEELAGLRERNRLARNLHDTVSQLLFSVVLTSRSAQILLDRDPPQVRRELEVLQELTATALNKLRSLISQLRP